MKIMRKTDLAKAFCQSEHTVGNRIAEIEKLPNRYPHAVIRDGKYVVCDFYAYYDYMEHRRQILNKENVAPFDPKGIRKALGA